MRRRKQKQRDGMTIMEIVVVLIIVGIVASMALPRYFIQIKKIRNQEALRILYVIYEAQTEYYRGHDMYAGDITSLFKENIAPRNFSAPEVYEDKNAGGARVVAGITDTKGEYTLYVNTSGNIICVPADESSAVCHKMGY